MGLFGYLYGSLEKTAAVKNLGVVNCDISASTDGARVGAIAGYTYYPVSLDRCYSSGTVSATGDATTIPLAGGLVGLLDIGGSITDCYNECTVESSYEAGGVAGCIYTQSTVNGCCNFGAVRGASIVGGICGANFAAKVINCANYGPVEAAPKVEGDPACVGGIAGISQSSGAGSCIENCINTGSVSSGEKSGGILGSNSGNIPVSDCYYLDSSAKGIGSGTDTTAKCTYDGMTKKATFEGFDFDHVWEIGKNGRLFPGLTALNLPACTKHVWSGWTEVRPAKCEVPGEKTRYCTVCGRIEKGTIDALQHVYGPWSVTTAPKCGVAGEETQICTVADCQHPQTRPVPALEHLWDGGTVTKASDCKSEGTKVFACTRTDCKATKDEAIPLGDHTFGEWKTVTAATCTENGEKERTCTVCSEKTEKETIKALGHDFPNPTELKAATCTEAGLEGGFCVRCNLEASQEIPAKGHSWGEETVVRPATHTEVGIREKKCSVCEEVYREEIPMLTDSSDQEDAHSSGSDASANSSSENSAEGEGSLLWILLVSGCVIVGGGILCVVLLCKKKK